MWYAVSILLLCQLCWSYQPYPSKGWNTDLFQRRGATSNIRRIPYQAQPLNMRSNTFNRNPYQARQFPQYSTLGLNPAQLNPRQNQNLESLLLQALLPEIISELARQQELERKVSQMTERVRNNQNQVQKIMTRNQEYKKREIPNINEQTDLFGSNDPVRHTLPHNQVPPRERFLQSLSKRRPVSRSPFLNLPSPNSPNTESIQNYKKPGYLSYVDYYNHQKKNMNKKKEHNKSNSLERINQVNEQIRSLLQSFGSSIPQKKPSIRNAPSLSKIPLSRPNKFSSLGKRESRPSVSNTRLLPKPVEEVVLPGKRRMEVKVPMSIFQSEARPWKKQATEKSQKPVEGMSPELSEMLQAVRSFISEQKKKKMAYSNVPFYSKPHTKFSSLESTKDSFPAGVSTVGRSSSTTNLEKDEQLIHQHSKLDQKLDSIVSEASKPSHRTAHVLPEPSKLPEGNICLTCLEKQIIPMKLEVPTASKQKITLSLEPGTLEILRKSPRTFALRPLLNRNNKEKDAKIL